MAKKSGSDDIKIGVSVVEPIEEKLTLLGSLKIKVPKLVKKNNKLKNKATEEKKMPKKATEEKKTPKKVTKTTKTDKNDIEK